MQHKNYRILLLKNIGFPQEKPRIIFKDNQGSILLAKNPKYHSRTKHIDIKYRYIRDDIENKTIQLDTKLLLMYF